MTTEYRPRLSVDIMPEQHRKIQKYFPHGTIKLVFRLVVDDLLAMIERHGAGVVLGCFIDRDIKLEEILRGNDTRFRRLDNEDAISRSRGDYKEGEGQPEDSKGDYPYQEEADFDRDD